MVKNESHKDVTVKEVRRILDIGKLITKALTPEELRELKEYMLQQPVKHPDMYCNQSLTR